MKNSHDSLEAEITILNELELKALTYQLNNFANRGDLLYPKEMDFLVRALIAPLDSQYIKIVNNKEINTIKFIEPTEVKKEPRQKQKDELKKKLDQIKFNDFSKLIHLLSSLNYDTLTSGINITYKESFEETFNNNITDVQEALKNKFPKLVDILLSSKQYSLMNESRTILSLQPEDISEIKDYNFMLNALEDYINIISNSINQLFKENPQHLHDSIRNLKLQVAQYKKETNTEKQTEFLIKSFESAINISQNITKEHKIHQGHLPYEFSKQNSLFLQSFLNLFSKFAHNIQLAIKTKHKKSLNTEILQNLDNVSSMIHKHKNANSPSAYQEKPGRANDGVAKNNESTSDQISIENLTKKSMEFTNTGVIKPITESQSDLIKILNEYINELNKKTDSLSKTKDQNQLDALKQTTQHIEDTIKIIQTIMGINVHYKNTIPALIENFDKIVDLTNNYEHDYKKIHGHRTEFANKSNNFFISFLNALTNFINKVQVALKIKEPLNDVTDSLNKIRKKIRQHQKDNGIRLNNENQI